MACRNLDHVLLAKFNALGAELADRAFDLECQGRCDAADVTNELRLRLAEFADDLRAPGARTREISTPDFP